MVRNKEHINEENKKLIIKLRKEININNSLNKKIGHKD
jgi:hypothetical protein